MAKVVELNRAWEVVEPGSVVVEEKKNNVVQEGNGKNRGKTCRGGRRKCAALSVNLLTTL